MDKIPEKKGTRFLHMSDLHLGKKLKEHPLDEDQRFMLGQMLGIADENHVDAVIIAGDVFDDGNATTVESVNLFDWFLGELSSRGLETFLISGNHDNQDRLGFGSGLFEKNGLHFCSRFDGRAERHTFKGVDIYLLPFIKPVHMRQFCDEQVETFEDAVRIALERSNVEDNGRRRILVTHQYVVSSERATELGGSERSYVGGTECVDASLFDGFDYVALGHIHSPQSVGRREVRYCGAPLKYSVDTRDRDKTATLVDVGDEIAIHEIPLKPLRDVRILKGPLEALIEAGRDDESKEDYIYAVIDTDSVDAMARLRSVFPNAVGLEVERKGSEKPLAPAAELEDLDIMTLLKRFYTESSGEEPTEYQLSVIEEIFGTEGEE